jgi:hypothetical protein
VGLSVYPHILGRYYLCIDVPQQRGIIGGVDFCAVHDVSKESRRLVLPRKVSFLSLRKQPLARPLPWQITLKSTTITRINISAQSGIRICNYNWTWLWTVRSSINEHNTIGREHNFMA